MAFVGQVHLYDSHFFADFTLDLLLLYRKMGGNQAKRYMNQQMWCLIIETGDSIYNIVFLTNGILTFSLMNSLIACLWFDLISFIQLHKKTYILSKHS